MYQQEKILLNPHLRCPDAVEFAGELSKRVIGQEEAVEKTTDVVQQFMAGLNDPNKPVGSVLLLGPTGTGKTRLVEAVCEVLFSNPKGMVRIDCAEFQHSHEIAKIIGAPPGYVGHSESRTQISQERLDRTHNEEVKLSVLLLDEIEKAHEDFWELLLGILDKARLTDSRGNVIDLTHTLIFMTSNLGAREVALATDGGIGFTTAPYTTSEIRRISANAASKKFSPEFINRLDHIISFRHLTDQALSDILEIEKNKIQKRLLDSKQAAKFVFILSDEVKEYILKEGTSDKYGARYLQRTLAKLIVTPLCNLILTSQVELGDLVEVSLVEDRLIFYRIPAKMISESDNDKWKDFKKAVDE